MTISFNGSSNPDNVFYNGTSLDNVYYNGVRVWYKESSASSSDTTVEVPEIAAPDFGFDDGLPESDTYKDTYSHIDLIKVIRSGKDEYYRDATFYSYALFIGTGEVFKGVIYKADATIELEWNSYYSIGTGINQSYLKLYPLTSTYQGVTGLPPNTALMGSDYAYLILKNLSITFAAELVGDGIYDPSRWVTRSYNCMLLLREGRTELTIYVQGDEYGLYTITEGYIYQGEVSLDMRITE